MMNFDNVSDNENLKVKNAVSHANHACSLSAEMNP